VEPRLGAAAAVTANALGSDVERLYDVGIAGMHRLLAARDRLNAANVIIVVAGMDGALPTIVGGIVAAPVIAVPTSIGYGTGLGGTAALMTMLNACAPGIAVVNIDNGFGAGYMAHLINARAQSECRREQIITGLRGPTVTPIGQNRLSGAAHGNQGCSLVQV
jgi:hypothetical protein